jgi:hypothetical protein
MKRTRRQEGMKRKHEEGRRQEERTLKEKRR